MLFIHVNNESERTDADQTQTKQDSWRPVCQSYTKELEYIIENDWYISTAHEFTNQSNVSFSPNSSVVALQGECVIGTPEVAVASIDATTCLIVLLWNPVTGVKAAVHIDQPNFAEQLTHEKIMEIICPSASVQNAMPRIHVGLVGAYNSRLLVSCSKTDFNLNEMDEISTDLVLSVLSALDTLQTVQFELHLAAILNLNTWPGSDIHPMRNDLCEANTMITDEHTSAHPKVFHAGITPNGTFVVPDITCLGPLPELRRLRFLRCDKPSLSIATYIKNNFENSKSNPIDIPVSKLCYRIDPFTLEDIHTDLLESWSRASDAWLLHNMSTSPDAEPATFCDSLRASFAFLARHKAIKQLFHPVQNHAEADTNIHEPLTFEFDKATSTWRQVR